MVTVQPAGITIWYGKAISSVTSMIALFSMAADSEVKSLTLNLGFAVGEGVWSLLGLGVGRREGRGVGEGVSPRLAGHRAI